MIFKKDDKIKMEGKTYIAICVDEETAVFAPVKRLKREKCVRTVYKGMFAFPNQDNFKKDIENNFEFVDVI